MNLKTLLNKTADTVKFIMAQPTMIFRNKEEIGLLNDAHVVNDDESARPDLIALQYYGNQSMLDIILKWNGISNPFSITEGDVLEIPNYNVPYFKLERPKEFEDNPVKQQFIDGKRLSKKDQRRLDALKKKYGKENLLPPNVIPVGKKNYEFVGTRIKMGAQVQTDPVVGGINKDLSKDGSGGSEMGSGTVVIGGDNTGSAFEKIPGGVWTWTGSLWVAVNPEIAQEVAGSLYGQYGNPNDNIKGTFEGQLYFDKLKDTTTGGDSIKLSDDRLNAGQGNANASGPADTSGTSGQSADNTGSNQNDGGNPTGSGNNSNNGTAGGGTSGTGPCG